MEKKSKNSTPLLSKCRRRRRVFLRALLFFAVSGSVQSTVQSVPVNTEGSVEGIVPAQVDVGCGFSVQSGVEGGIHSP